LQTAVGSTDVWGYRKVVHDGPMYSSVCGLTDMPEWRGCRQVDDIASSASRRITAEERENQKLCMRGCDSPVASTLYTECLANATVPGFAGRFAGGFPARVTSFEEFRRW